jgi:putative hydrolase of the HAD superfamily
VTLFEDALPALEFLAARYPLVALTNGNADVQRIGLGRFFHASINAREFGVGKPDPRIFHAAAGAMDVMPERVLHIGDDATLDALGALNAGMQAAGSTAPTAVAARAGAAVTADAPAELCDLFRVRPAELIARDRHPARTRPSSVAG